LKKRFASTNGSPDLKNRALPDYESGVNNHLERGKTLGKRRSGKMARKLFIMVTLTSLVLLAQVIPGLADTYYYLNNLGSSFQGHYSWTETISSLPGSAGSTFSALSNYPAEGYIPGSDWSIPLLAINPAKTVYTASENGADVTVTSYYDTPASGPLGTPLFVANVYYNSSDGLKITDKSIISTDMVFTTTATYRKDTNSIYPIDYNSVDYADYTLYGEGYYSDGTYFTLEASLYNLINGATHQGTMTGFSIIYPDAVPAPIPGAVWLLNTGFLGLACVGRRRRS
jgi:hypothetical protein